VVAVQSKSATFPYLARKPSAKRRIQYQTMLFGSFPW